MLVRFSRAFRILIEFFLLNQKKLRKHRDGVQIGEKMLLEWKKNWNYAKVARTVQLGSTISRIVENFI